MTSDANLNRALSLTNPAHSSPANCTQIRTQSLYSDLEDLLKRITLCHESATSFLFHDNHRPEFIWGNMSSSKSADICFLGCGQMASCILGPLLELKPAWVNKITACTRTVESAEDLRERFSKLHSAHYGDELRLSVVDADILVLGCKPYMAEKILKNYTFELTEQSAVTNIPKVLISICAGVTMEQLDEYSPDTINIRAMPNVPAQIGEGMTLMSQLEPSWLAKDQVPIFDLEAIFKPAGRVKQIEEKYFDACTALSGSGPAFACLFMEAMISGALSAGLPAKLARELAAQTMLGTSKMILSSEQHPAVFRDSVTTPGGCTIAGLMTMEQAGVRSGIANGIRDAAVAASKQGAKSSK